MDTVGRFMFRRAGLVASLVIGFALVAAPAALADNDTIQAEATVQFSGVVDGTPSCSDQASTASIDWGDGNSSSGTINPNSGAVSGSHTYAVMGTYSGEISFTNGSCDGMTDSFTANVSAPPAKFTECPPVYFDSSCQFQISVTANGYTVQTDSNQPAYEDEDDSLIGIVNNGTGPISSIPLSVPGSILFGFDGDGICNPGGSPLPVGPAGQQCVGPAGTTCGTQDQSCAFPAPAGEPAGYVATGYEGPTSWFSNISTDTSSGTVNFTPALRPGQSTFFSLEEPPVGTTISAGSSPSAPTAAPPTVSATGADFTGTVDPNGSPTVAYFQYSLDPKYGKLATGGQFSQSTPKQSLGGDFSTHSVSASVSNLVPDAVYDVRLVATNGSGTSIGQTVKFSTKKSASPGTPTIGKNFNASTSKGLILVKLDGKFVPLTELRQIPNNTVIDALGGTLSLTTSSGKKGKKFTGTFAGAIFKLSQTKSGANKGLTTVTLVETAFKGAPSYNSCKAKGAGDGPLAQAALSSKVLQTLRSKAKGKFRSKGRYASGTVLGTQWTTADQCNGTKIAVQVDSVLVTDLITNRSLRVFAHHSFLALAPKGKHK